MHHAAGSKHGAGRRLKFWRAVKVASVTLAMDVTKDNICAACGNSSKHRVFPVEALRTELINLIRNDCPQIAEADGICEDCLGRYRVQLAALQLEQDRGELDDLEKSVLASMTQDKVIASNVNDSFDQKLSLGARVADKVAEFGGSWSFILLALLMISVWMVFNMIGPARDHFDPYPFILLNLALSCTAALQAPIIMMSQNRQEQKDRIRSEQDYQTNLKAELEVRQLHDKVDFLLTRQMRRLLELQEVQIEMLRDLNSPEFK